MTEKDLEYFKNWFSEYTKSFYSSNEEDQRNIILKIEHTRNVRKNILQIAEGLSLSKDRMRLAETAALFHDIGRFPQYAEYKTFRDAISLSHGLLGKKTLIKEGVLERLPEDERELILKVVNFHGAFSIPTTFEGETVLFLKMLRDADKVDIFRVFLEYYESPPEERASATAFGVPDSPECSEIMLTNLHNREVASYMHIKTENDFKLMKLSWIYALNFDESIRMLQERGLIEKLISLLPQTDEIKAAMDVLRNYINERLGEGQ
ncbi:MAG: HD domain-containing protein [Nitrospira sp.]|nr:HD domain-containing protein [Nitrospira sp.]